MNGLTTDASGLGNLLMPASTDGKTDASSQLQLYLMLAKMLMGQQAAPPQASLPTLGKGNVAMMAQAPQQQQGGQLQQLMLLRALMQQNPNLLMGNTSGA